MIKKNVCCMGIDNEKCRGLCFYKMLPSSALSNMASCSKISIYTASILAGSNLSMRSGSLSSPFHFCVRARACHMCSYTASVVLYRVIVLQLCTMYYPLSGYRMIKILNLVS